MSIKMPISVRGVQFTVIRFTELYLEKSEFPNGKNASKSYFFFYCNTLHVSSKCARVKSHRLAGSHVRIRVTL